MGIRDLNRLIDAHAASALRPLRVDDVRGARWAVDANIYLYRFMSAQPHDDGRHLTRFRSFVRWLRSLGVEPIFVFDGDSPVEKELELEQRRENKRAASRRLRDIRRAVATMRHIQGRWRQISLLLGALVATFDHSTVASPASSVVRSAFLQVVAEVLEAATDTWLPTHLIEALIDASHFAALDTCHLVTLTQCAARLRMDWYHPSLVELDWTFDDSNDNAVLLIGGEPCAHSTVPVDDATFVSVRTATASLERGTPIFNDPSSADTASASYTQSTISGATSGARAAHVATLLAALLKAARTSTGEACTLWIRCSAVVAAQLQPVLNDFKGAISDMWQGKATAGFRVAVLLQNADGTLRPLAPCRLDGSVLDDDALHWIMQERQRDPVTDHETTFRAHKREPWENRSLDGDALLLDIVGAQRYGGNTLLRPITVECELFTDLHIVDPINVVQIADDEQASNTATSTTATSTHDEAAACTAALQQRTSIASLDAAPPLRDGTGDALIAQLETSARKLAPQTTRVTGEQLEECYALLRQLDVAVVHAEHEAEATCVRLCRAGLADCVVTEDLDAIPFGAGTIVRKLAFANNGSTRARGPAAPNIVIGECLDCTELQRALHLNAEQVIDLCIACGCDFCGNLSMVGSSQALDLMQRHGSLDGVRLHLMRKSAQTRAGTAARRFNVTKAAQARALFLRNHSDTLPDTVASQPDVARLL